VTLTEALSLPLSFSQSLSVEQDTRRVGSPPPCIDRERTGYESLTAREIANRLRALQRPTIVPDGAKARILPWRSPAASRDLLAASIYDKCSVGPSVRPIWTRYCFTMTNMIKVCSNCRCARVFIINTRPDKIVKDGTNARIWPRRSDVCHTGVPRSYPPPPQDPSVAL